MAQVLQPGRDGTQYAICSCDYDSSWQTCSKVNEQFELMLTKMRDSL